VNLHPELGLRLAQTKIEEARSRAERASALRADSLDERLSGATVGTRRDRWAALGLARVRRSQARDRSLRPRAPRTTKG
jgi:hypothetical protein